MIQAHLQKQFFRLLFMFLSAFLIVAGSGCREEKDADVRGDLVDIDVTRVDSLMYGFARAIRIEDSLRLGEAYQRFVEPELDFFAAYLLLPPQMQNTPVIRDSFLTSMLARGLRDSILYALLDTVRQVFPYDQDLAIQIAAPLTRLRRLFPDINIPRFTTHVNGYPPQADWRMVDQVVSFPGIISFGLHYFMGKDWPFYPAGVYEYQRKRFEPDNMDVALVEVISEEFIPPLSQTEEIPLVHRVVRAGMKQQMMHQLLPYTPDSVLLRYSSDQMEWARNFESANFKLLMQHFFETDSKYERDYISDKAFTSELSRESAPRLGEYVGWRMVESYLERHPGVTLPELIEITDYEAIMRESGYKP